MNVQHILNRGRQLAESLMTDQCRVTHMGKPVTDPETGLVGPAANTVYEGRCKVQTSGGLAAENTEVGIVEALGAVTPRVEHVRAFPLRHHGFIAGRRVRDNRSRRPESQGAEAQVVEHAVREVSCDRMPVEREGGGQQQ